MSETLSASGFEIEIPEAIDRKWLDDFNDQYGDDQKERSERFTATLTTEDWLEQSDTGDYGSGYFTLSDRMGSDGWKQIISGKVVVAAHTNVPHYTDATNANVLALSQAYIEEADGSVTLLAEGRHILIRLDRVIGNPVLKPVLQK